MGQTVALIPARGGSKGIPKKNIKFICGKPLIAWSIEQGLSAELVDRVIVSTDSEEIARVAKDYGAEVPFLRPAVHSSDRASTESVMLHLLDWFTEAGINRPEKLVLLQPTSPVRLAHSIDQALEQFAILKADSLLSVCEQRNFLWKRSAGSLESLYNYKDRPRRQDVLDRDRFWFENGSIYISRVDNFLEYKNRLFGHIVPFVMADEEGFEIDDQLDWLIVESLLANFLADEK